ncbi:C6 zinc finger domain-containing protein, partial [Colletotrichum musicola]
MDPGQPDSKRPRLSTTSSWSPTGAPQHQLPPLHPPTPHQQAHQPHHPAPPLPPYHQQQPPASYPPRSAEPHYPPHPAQYQQHPEERRHHDQDPPHTPMQDHYRHPPSPSPAHPSYNHFPPKDPGGVKREPHEDNLPHPRRPHSTGGAPQDGLPPPGPHPPPPHSAPPPPVPPYSDDPRRPPHMTYDNPPPPMPPTPGGYRSSYPPPPMPQQPPQQYEQPPYHSQPPPESIYSVSYASTQKRKATRASQVRRRNGSCLARRLALTNVSGLRQLPTAQGEVRRNEALQKLIDKSQTDILEGIHDLKTLIESRFIQVDRRLQALEDGAPRSKAVKLEKDASASSMSPPAKSPPSPEPTYHQLAPGPIHEEPAPMAVGETSLADADMMDTVDEERAPGAAVDPGQPSIPINHTSPVNLLLTWPAIKEMT